MNLYTERPTWLDLAHQRLGAAVFAANGWDPAMTDGDVLAELLALNLSRSTAQRPHPARRDGEGDGKLTRPGRRSGQPPSASCGWFAEIGRVFARRNLVHHPGELDGVPGRSRAERK
jgi:hypothetical protein